MAGALPAGAGLPLTPAFRFCPDAAAPLALPFANAALGFGAGFARGFGRSAALLPAFARGFAGDLRIFRR